MAATDAVSVLKIASVSLTPNPVAVGASFVVSVQIDLEWITPQTVAWYSDEVYSGEDS